MATTGDPRCQGARAMPGPALDAAGGFRRKERHISAPRATRDFVWELTPSQRVRGKCDPARTGARKKLRVFVRVRPTDAFAHETISYGEDDKTIHIHLKKDPRKGVVNNQQTHWSFELDGVLHEAPQDVVYETVAEDAVGQALDGSHGTVMCYGQTGAGKTYTMMGAPESYQLRGILPRAIQQVFRMSRERLTHDTTVRVSYLEIYRESLFDLLATLPRAAPPATPVTIMENPQGVFMKGLSVHLAGGEEEAFSLLFEGETNRVTASRAMNRSSSRSHCIFTIYVEARPLTSSEENHLTSRINLVDLAGSERLRKAGPTGPALREAASINKSLSFLQQAILALGDPRREHVPFRQCKLTHALKDSLVGDCNVVLVTNVRGEAAQLEETLSSLGFAGRMKLATHEPSVNAKRDAERTVRSLERELAQLRQELAGHDRLNSRRTESRDPMDKAQIAQISSQVQRYLEGTLDEIDVVNVRQVQEVFHQFREALCQHEQEVECALRRKYTLVDKDDVGSVSAVQEAEPKDADGHLVVDSDGQGFGLGVAALVPKPAKKSRSRKMLKESRSSLGRKEGASSPVSGKDVDTSTSRIQLTLSSKDQDVQDAREQDWESSPVEAVPSDTQKEEPRPPRPSTPPPKPAAFEDFKSERGSEINRIFKENKSILNERRKTASDATRRINAIKREMDVTREALTLLTTLRKKQGEYENEGLVVVDEKEFLLMLKLKDLKRQYREERRDLQDLWAEIQYCQHMVDQCRQRLLTEFETWYDKSFLTPEEPQVVLKPASSIQLGMTPVSKIVSLHNYLKTMVSLHRARRK